MYKVSCEFDKQKVIKMNKSIDKGAIISSICMCALLLVIGAITLVMGLTEEKINWLSVAIGGFACIFSIFPVINTISTSKKGLENAVKQTGVETTPLKIEYVFKEKRIEVKQYKGDTVKEETIMFKNVASLKKTKYGISFYLDDGVMYYFEYGDIVVGTVEQILALFKKNNVKVPKM